MLINSGPLFSSELCECYTGFSVVEKSEASYFQRPLVLTCPHMAYSFYDGSWRSISYLYKTQSASSALSELSWGKFFLLFLPLDLFFVSFFHYRRDTIIH